MSRFVDRNATERMPLGPCACPGTPHEEGDWIDMRTQLGTADLERMAQGTGVDTLELLIVSWNLLDPDGSKAPVDRDHIDRLYGEVFDTLEKWTSEHIRSTVTLPNARAASSRSSSRGSGSQIRQLKKAG